MKKRKSGREGERETIEVLKYINRPRERQKERDREKQREREGRRERKRVCVCVWCGVWAWGNDDSFCCRFKSIGAI